jgi:flavoprotein
MSAGRNEVRHDFLVICDKERGDVAVVAKEMRRALCETCQTHSRPAQNTQAETSKNGQNW